MIVNFKGTYIFYIIHIKAKGLLAILLLEHILINYRHVTVNQLRTTLGIHNGNFLCVICILQDSATIQIYLVPMYILTPEFNI